MPLLDWVNRNQAEETASQVPFHCDLTTQT